MSGKKQLKKSKDMTISNGVVIKTSLGTSDTQLKKKLKIKYVVFKQLVS